MSYVFFSARAARALALFLYRFPGLFPERKLHFSRYIFSLTAIEWIRNVRKLRKEKGVSPITDAASEAWEPIIGLIPISHSARLMGYRSLKAEQP